MADLQKDSRGLSLSQLAPRGRFIGVSDIRFQACCADWKQCRPGDLYVAIESAQQDGHDFIDGAIKNGATAVLAERFLISDVPVCVVDDARETYGRICQMLAGDPTGDLKVIGITGTNGKTTIAHLVHAILSEAGLFSGLMSSLVVDNGFIRTPAQFDSPGAPQLASDLAAMAMNGCSHAVIEVSSKSLAQKHLAGMQLDAAIVSNLRRDHLDFHGNVVNYRKAKAQLLDLVSPAGFAVMNADDAESQKLLDEIQIPTITVGWNNHAEVTATILETHRSEQTFLLHAGNESIPVRTAMIGEHHVRNCLSAAGVALVMGIDLTTIVRGLESVTRLSGRLERVECGQPFGVFVDYAQTPDQLATSLKTLRKHYSGNLFCVYGSAAEDAQYHGPWMGKLLERACDRPIITGANESPRQSLRKAHQLLDGFERPAKAHLIPDREAAICYALEQAYANDCVLIAGQGEKPSWLSQENGLPLQDRQICEQWLYQVGAHKAYSQPEPQVMSYRIQDYQF